jgi:serine/threonine-protein kinase
VTGGCLPTMIWQEFMTRAIRRMDLPVRDFPEPPPPPKAQVPDVEGRQVGDAQAILRRAQFRLQATSVSSHEPAGTVLRQTPTAGTSLELGAAVVVSVSDGLGPPPGIPDLVGMTEQEASNALAEAGLLGRAQDIPVSNPDLVGRVVSQSPPAGTPISQAGEIIVRIGASRSEPGPP